MGKGTLTIYSASAGSGKTYNLTGLYLSRLFSSRYAYRRILAVTFTNKATAEMKGRILDQLYALAEGKQSGYLENLMSLTSKTEPQIREEAKVIFDLILNDFSRFSISTIDSFFQKIIRAFARDIGLQSGFETELDNSAILSMAVDEMIASASENKVILHWLTDFARSNISEGKNWNLKTEIVNLAGQLFKEDFKLLTHEERQCLQDKDFLSAYHKEMISITASFETRLRDYGSRCQHVFSDYNLSDDMFYMKGKGIPSYIRSLARGDIKPPNKSTREIFSDPPRWSTGTMSSQLRDALSAGLEINIREAILFYDENIINYNTANNIRSNIFALGILSDIFMHIHKITATENSFLLSDAGEMLHLITSNDQTPFIYEKTGSRFDNFMIDEFQDTSAIQWNNFSYLIDNSMAEGFDNVLVGDIKQSVYRWRNSDWRILGRLIKKGKESDRIISKQLKVNWRSCANIIDFNNSLFTVIPHQLDEEFIDSTLPQSFREFFSEAIQENPGRKEDGYVRLEFVDDNDDADAVDVILNRLPEIIAMFQDKGYRASDIGILVRNNRDGVKVMERLMEYSSSCDDEKKPLYNWDVVSNESLLLSESSVISFIISVLYVLNDENDEISKARMLRFFNLSAGNEEAEKVNLSGKGLINEILKYFPDGYAIFLESLKQLPLFEITESIIRFFSLGQMSWNVAFINAFQDHVLSFTTKRGAGISNFLEWWEKEGVKKSVSLPENINAIRIMTIHKSKGLEFKIVIIPFISWDLHHKHFSDDFLWVKPDSPPFNKLSILPVKYKNELEETIFKEYFNEEKYSSVLDNINLLYVAFTRAIDAIYGFVPNCNKNTVAKVVNSAVRFNLGEHYRNLINLMSYFNPETNIFEYGTIPLKREEYKEKENITAQTYYVKQDLESLKLKLHGENYFISEDDNKRAKINYGKLMHEVFENIITSADIQFSVNKMVLEGRISVGDAPSFQQKVTELVEQPVVNKWFAPGNRVLTESAILIPGGELKRPDRVVFMDGCTVVIDFKFGKENSHYTRQLREYSNLVAEMGSDRIEAFIWYVDLNKIEKV